MYCCHVGAASRPAADLTSSSPATCPPSLSADFLTPVLPTSSATSPQAVDAMKAEIKADVVVVSNLKKLEDSFGRMLVQVKRLLVDNKCDLSDALLYLDSVIGSEDFIGCDNFGKIVRQLQRNHIDVLNISIIQQLVANFDNQELTKVVEAYNEKKKEFLEQTTVIDFQRAVVSKVKPILSQGKASVTITISQAYDRTLRDIEKLTMEGFEECHKEFVSLHAELGSVIVSWVFPGRLCAKLEQLARRNFTVFEKNGVVEVTVAGKIAFPCTQQEVRIKT